MFQKIAGLIALVTEAIHQHKIYKANGDSADFTFHLKQDLARARLESDKNIQRPVQYFHSFLR